MAQIPPANHSPSLDFEVSLVNEQSVHAVDEQQLVAVAKAILCDSEFTSAAVSIAVVDDATIQELNRRYLEHDWPTDVLSFSLGADDGHLEGEVILSAETAAAAAAEFGSTVAAEQALYVIHGALHLIGYGDKTPGDAQAMRAAETRYMKSLGFGGPTGFDSPEAPSQDRDEPSVRRGATAP